jgi:hypothetical protein
LISASILKPDFLPLHEHGDVCHSMRMCELELVRQVGITDSGQQGVSLCHGSITLEDSDVKAWIALTESPLFPLRKGPAVSSHVSIGITRNTGKLAANVLASLFMSELDFEPFTPEYLFFDLLYSMHVPSFELLR